MDGKDIKERKELALKWDQDACTWAIQGEAEEYKMSKARQEVLSVVSDADGPVTPTYVANALGKSVNTVKKMMWEMSRDGQLASTGSGRYYTPNNGNRSNPSNPDDETVTGVTGGLLESNPENPHRNGANAASVTGVTGVTGAARKPRFTPERADEVKRLMREGMGAAEARAEVLGGEA